MASKLLAGVMLVACVVAQAQDAAPQLSGQVRAQWDGVHANTAGPLAAAHALQADRAAVPMNAVMLETELRASGKDITTVLTLQQQRNDGQTTASTAWSLVWVNPTAATDTWGAQEPALAARLYQRFGAADWYGFARVGLHTGTSLGAALAWVVTDALDMHSSLRFSKQIGSQSIDPHTTALVARNPWQPSTVPNVTQWLVGGTWTTSSQLSLLTEVWWDGSAPSDAQ